MIYTITGLCAKAYTWTNRRDKKDFKKVRKMLIEDLRTIDYSTPILDAIPFLRIGRVRSEEFPEVLSWYVYTYIIEFEAESNTDARLKSLDIMEALHSKRKESNAFTIHKEFALLNEHYETILTNGTQVKVI